MNLPHHAPSEEGKPKLLVLSFSFVAADARILKQIRLFNSDFNVVSCGFGPAPEGVHEHIELEHGEPRGVVLFRAALLRLRAYRAAYAVTPAVLQARRALRGRRFSAVLANDLDTAGVAVSVFSSATVHLDIHEYWPGRQDQNAAWVKVRRPYYVWQLKKYAGRVRSVTTVSRTIAERYQREFGIDASVVTNASPVQTLRPTPVGSPLRLVHSGASLSNRRLEVTMRAVAAARNGVTLDLYLVGAGTAYHESLVELAAALGDRVRILPPVRNEELVKLLNRYDVGVHVLPPTNLNNSLALPNKFFDYVQARLALLIGPTESMAELLSQYDLGSVTQDFEMTSIVAAIESLTPDRVTHFKMRSHAAANELSSEVQNAVWDRAIRDISVESLKQ